MADEDKDKAEKVAAAKKRYEQIKKQKAKESKKGGSKKKDEKSAADSKVEDAAEEDPPAAEEKPAETEEPQAGEEESTADNSDSPKPQRQPSVSQQSKKRSESFRQGATSPGGTDLKAGAGPLSPSAEVQDLYRKQATRIEELEKENSAFKEQQEDSAARLAKAEEEAESLREGSSDVARLKSRAEEAEKLQTEVASLQRQLSQAQQSAKGPARKQSTAGADLSGQLASKTSTIEALELELSNLRNQVNTLETSASDTETSTKTLTDRATTAESTSDSLRRELEALKVSISSPSDETTEDPAALQKRITVLEFDLRSANDALDTAAQRATSLEQKIEALTNLHRDATTTSQSKDKELSDLRSQLRNQHRPSHVKDASEFDLADDETETGVLRSRIRALEAESFDLKRGIWRDKRAEMQPGMDDQGQYEDVDLTTPGFHNHPPLPSRQTSSFQDVISSGISAFTGGTREGANGTGQGRGRGQSMGLLSEEDDEFDEEAFRLAQEEEAKRRIERVKEVKRGLEQWRGWRVDLVDTRRGGVGGGRECGAVFEI